MIKQTSKNLKALFLLQFTKELIKSSEIYRELKIKAEVRRVIKEKEIKDKEREELKPEREIREIVKEKIEEDEKKITQLEKEGLPIELATLSKPIRRIRQRPKILRIPELMLPPTVQHIRPIPTRREMDLGRLNPLIRDPLVRTIECNGPNEKIVVGGTMGRKNTGIILSKEEIDQTIKKFSEEAKIPIDEGLFKVAIGRLILSAIVSGVVGSKFIIKKMVYGY